MLASRPADSTSSTQPLPSPTTHNSQPTPTISTLLPVYLSTSQSHIAARVIDGDTIEIEGGKRVRYIGINSPEADECFGLSATEANKDFVLGKNVRLEKDISETDKYGRLLRYVWVGDTLVNDYLVKNGFAHSSSYPPDIKYQAQFNVSEKEARDNNRGLWHPSACNSNLPNYPNPPNLPNSTCNIKGNISSKGEKIYHTPGQRYYDKTQIDEAAGERYFCSEVEAENAGWRKSKI